VGRRLVSLRGLEVGYGGKAILPRIDLSIDAGTFCAVIGPNGAGKTIFLRTLLGLLPPVRGVVERAAGLRPAYVPQQAELDPIFPVRVRDFVLMGRIGPGRLLGPARRVDVEAAEAALEAVKVGHLGRAHWRDLSGGQRQRVLVARALAAEANLYVLDEPTAALDLATEREVLELASELGRRGGAAVVMVTHLVEEGLARADRALLLDRDGGLALAGTPGEIRASRALARLHGPLVDRRGEGGAGEPQP
jgi:zinc transport system ATP-binding protein